MTVSLHRYTCYGKKLMVPLYTRALVIDDEPLVLGTIGQAVRAAVRCVDEETSARRGIALFAEHRHPVVVLDLMMPEMSGIDVLAQIQELEPRTQVIIVTGFASKDSAVRALNLHAFRLLEKPVVFKLLQQVVADAWAAYQRSQPGSCAAEYKLDIEIASLYTEVARLSEALESAPNDPVLVAAHDRELARLRRVQATEAEAAVRTFRAGLSLNKGAGYASIDAARQVIDRDRRPA